MTVAGAVSSFEEAVHKANKWVEEVGGSLGWEDHSWSYRALRSTLHALRDRLTVEESAHLGAQLPLLIRGIYYEGWTPAGKPLKERRKEQFLAHVKKELLTEDDNRAMAAAQAVFGVLEKHISGGEISDVKHMLPEDIRSLWP